MKRFAAVLSTIALLAVQAMPLHAATTQPGLAVTGYVIDAQVNPANHTLTAQAKVTFTVSQPQDAAVFELHGGLQVKQVLDDKGQALSGERGPDATVRITPPQPLVAGQTYTWTFSYTGTFADARGGSVEGLKLVSVADPVSYLLYAGRWFPMVGYSTDRFTADVHVYLPAGYTAVGSGAVQDDAPGKTVSVAQAEAAAEPARVAGAPTRRRKGQAAPGAPTTAAEQRRKNGTAQPGDDDTDAAAPPPQAGVRTKGKESAAAPQPNAMALPGGREFHFSWTKPGFPGTLIIGRFLPPVTEAGSPLIRVYTTAEHAASAAAYADTANREFAFFTSTFGPAESNHLNVVELPDDTVPAAWAPEIAGIAAARLANKSDFRLLANTMAHQWWGSEVSPATLNDTWITNGMARYGELLYLEDQQGKSALQNALLDVSAGALAYDTIPLSSVGRLPVFSPEFQSMTLEKGAMVFHMLRWMIGDDASLKLYRGLIADDADKGISGRDFRKLAEADSQQQLTAFFSQWLDGTGAPEFKNQYAVYRLGNDKGFRTIGTLQQDLDLFNMPVQVQIRTQGKTESQRVQVEGTSSQYVIDTFGMPRTIEVDPDNWILKNSPTMQVRIAILKGQQLAGQGDLNGALGEYQKALAANPASSLASYRIGDVLFAQHNYQGAADAYRDALRGEGEPAWTQVWSHIALGKIFDATGQRDRALNEYRLALQTNDNTSGALNQARAYIKKAYQAPEGE